MELTASTSVKSLGAQAERALSEQFDLFLMPARTANVDGKVYWLRYLEHQRIS